MNKKALIVLPILSVLALTGCGSNEEPSSTPAVSSSEPATTSEAEPSSSSVDPNANKRVTQAIFTSEVTEYGMFGIDRKVTVTGTSPDLGGENYSISMTTKFDNGKVSIKQETKAKTDGTVVDAYEAAFLLEKDAEDGKIYYKERYAQNGQGEWQKNTTKAEFDMTAMYDMGIIPDKYVFSNFTFDEATGTYKCPSIQTQIYGDDYLVENIEISFQNNKVMSISNKFTSQNADHPGSYSMTSVFSAYGTTTVELPEVQEEPVNKGLSDIFLEMGEEAMYLSASKERPAKKGLLKDPAPEDYKNCLNGPSITLYMIGKLYLNNEFDCLEKVVSFNGSFDGTQSGMNFYEDMTFSVMIKIDRPNNNIKVYARQDLHFVAPSHTMDSTTITYIDAEYDFDKGEATSFKVYSETGMTSPMVGTSFYYFQYIGGVGKRLDTTSHDDEYNEIYTIYETAKTEFNSKYESKTFVDKSTPLGVKYGQSLINATIYSYDVLEIEGSIQFHQDA